MQTKSNKTEELIKSKLESIGSTETAVFLVNYFLRKETHNGITLNELPDTSTLANGIDSIEECFDDQDFAGAVNIARETAQDMLEDEGFEIE